MVHQSWLKDSDSYDFIFHIAQQKKIKLVLFSGGITQISFAEISEVEILHMPVNMFYSSNLLNFLNGYPNDNSLYRLAYGPKYKLNELLQKRKNSWIAGEAGEEMDVEIKEFIYE